MTDKEIEAELDKRRINGDNYLNNMRVFDLIKQIAKEERRKGYKDGLKEGQVYAKEEIIVNKYNKE